MWQPKGCFMTEEAARRLFKQYGWTWRTRPRRRYGTRYLYAERWGKQQKKVERYIAPLSRLPQLTETDLVAKLTKS
jgi:hypothetical protein